MEYGKQLNPERSLRTPKGIKGTRQNVIVTHKPSEIDQAQELLVRFPNLGIDDVIIPRMWCYCHYSASALVPGSIWAHAHHVRGNTLADQHS